MNPSERQRVSELAFMTEVVQPVLVKAGDLFLIARSDGSVPAESEEGFGLYLHDCRYLGCYELAVGGQPMMAVISSSAGRDTAMVGLANNRYVLPDGGFVEQQSLGVRWERRLDPERRALRDRVYLRNHMTETLRAPLTLRLASRFEDLFELRGRTGLPRGELHAPRFGRDRVLFRYDGADGVVRRLNAGFSPAPTITVDDLGVVEAVFDFVLAPQEVGWIDAVFRIGESARGERPSAGRRVRAPAPDTVFDSDDARLNGAMHGSLRDLRMLRHGSEPDFVAGGLPWFVALFGRDSLVSALQSLAFAPEIAAGTLRRLAALQGRKFDPVTGEEPGKILHELRVGETARLGAVPFTPGYQSIDSTPLFLILTGLHAQWTGSLALFTELRAAVDAALAWMLARLDTGQAGFLDYDGVTAEGPINQGWKDSASAVRRADGALPEPPIALVEVQAYAFKALTQVADLYRRAGEAEQATALEGRARDLARRFDRAFWREDEGCYSLALERGGRPTPAITSNAGHALWGGVAPANKAERLAARLMREDMFCGWGVRTLSDADRAYNPFHYHLGSVWPFDNSLIVAGLADYGLTEPARRIVDGMLAAAACFSLSRLPEFFVGLQREPDLYPGRCPFADPLQAWSAGALPYMITALLGLRPDGFARTLRVARPVLPSGVNRLRLRTSVGGAPVECRFERRPDGEIAVSSEGEITVVRGDAP